MERQDGDPGGFVLFGVLPPEIRSVDTNSTSLLPVDFFATWKRDVCNEMTRNIPEATQSSHTQKINFGPELLLIL